MQLGPPRGGRRLEVVGRVVALVMIAALACPLTASAADDAKPPARPIKPDDPTVKRAALEIAGYTDSDHVSVFTPSVRGSIENVTTGASLHGQYLLDVVSAASVDIVSTASRRWTEARHAGSVEAVYKPRNFGISVGGGASSEPDYRSYGLSVQLTQDFDDKNTTAVFGYGFGHDTSGRTGTPFSVFSRELIRGTFSGGINQVINRSTLATLSLDVIIENGDPSKPYRYVPMFSATNAARAEKGATIEWVTAHRVAERPLEQLPLSRRRFALTGRISHRFDSSTLRVSERLYDDTWGLRASTTDARWFFDVGRRITVWPHVRFHGQVPVSFWQRAYVSAPATGWDLPEFRTGDRELGPLWTVSGGGGLKLFVGSEQQPRAWAIGVDVDATYTSFLDDLYLTARTGVLGALTLEAEL